MTMLKRIPVIPTLIVLIAVGIMIWLGFWQLDRMHQKQTLLVRYAAARQLPSFNLERLPYDPRTLLYRRVSFNCHRIEGGSDLAGRNAKGEVGWAHTASCSTIEPDLTGPDRTRLDGRKLAELNVVIGWSKDPRNVAWAGGAVTGTIAPGAGAAIRVIADPPLAGLAANARPDPADLPNNHLSYAVQWFLFALTALAIYGLALRKRLAAPGVAG